MRLLTWLTITAGLCGMVAAALLFHEPSRSYASHLADRARGGYTVEQRVQRHQHDVAMRLKPAFAAVGLAYPPYEVAYLAFKDTRRLEVYARGARGEPWRFVKAYPVLAASGKPGPKLKEGDLQVPEGVYRAEYLNPNSRFHLSIRLNYPNEFDRRMARNDGRTRLGGDIMIHGSSVSIGCLAMGDEAAEDLFILSARVSKERTRIVVSPVDFRIPGHAAPSGGPEWAHSLYDTLRTELARYPRGPERYAHVRH
ncbi:L,D-transpeptidase family protein [Schlegelella sp. S2-27]|uniref:L,D-transpeptidase family protein n=1 Tax=Caldimonas mangrovi TaxID=2944811 RepID=A0ABT0YTQ5_9BURK|nr:L,D-transpeptidase family protein [Caldimonas mangrovi]MCM5681779.1 L,D-transpeptidase family protein [Caldimonas mangrovi]